jgi:CHASE2 domain-containing sensor protein
MGWLSSFRRKGKEAGNGGVPRGRIFAWAAAICLICGAIEFGEPIEDVLRIARNWTRQQEASGQIIVVGIDDKSLKELEAWPWPRGQHAKLAESLSALGARGIFFDIDFSQRSRLDEDRKLARTLATLGHKVTLASVVSVDPATKARTEIEPLPAFRRHARTANINFDYNRQMSVWKIPYAWPLRERSEPTLSAAMAQVAGTAGDEFPIDYSINPRTIPTLSAVDVLRGRVAREQVAGKTVVIGATSPQLKDIYVAPGYAGVSGVYIHVLGAETLMRGRPLDLGWLIPYLLALAITLGACFIGRLAAAVGTMGVAALSYLLAPLLLESRSIHLDVVPSVALLGIVAVRLSWQEFRRASRLKATTNQISGLPNLNALRQLSNTDRRPLIAARIQNFPAITASLPSEQEKAFVEQIAKRLAVGRADQALYQGDEGIFAWFADEASAQSLSHQMEALHALFRSPIVVAGNQFDLTITFGVETGSDRSLGNRLGSALVAADEAGVEGIRWKHYDPAQLEDSAWKLSLLSQLDAAIDAGDLWVAYQPKLDMQTRTIIGAEALARWSHPTKGAISPLEFISAAEQSDRIEKLTAHVLDRAIAAGASINRRGIGFDISVNLSARLIDDRTLTPMITTLLERHGLDAARLTLEVTETAAISSTERSLEALLSLRYWASRSPSTIMGRVFRRSST